MIPHYRMAILLSTYNGAKYLPELLQSLAEQRYKNWMLLWRDDGSTDESVAIVESFSTCHPEGKIFRLKDDAEHLGPLGSFLKLLRNVPDFVINFAFCDQDDIWLPHKLDRAISHIQSTKSEEPILYCSRLKIVDADLQEIGETLYPRRLFSIANALAQNIVSGCTIVLNQAARKLVTSTLPPEQTMHDWWCYIVVTAAGGHIIFDNETGILYRQHATNEIGIPQTLVVRLIRAYSRGAMEFLDLLRRHSDSLKESSLCLTKESDFFLKRIEHIFCGSRMSRVYSVFKLGLYRRSFIETSLLYLWLASTIMIRGRFLIHQGQARAVRK